ncbi:MAG: hypothetical protein QM638_01280 [Nocardioides sp.]|uniref:hypothetical protein n=1 Tax=Nocardioides sp. TaxID=35761 RepID=UPI0039E47F60
MKQIKGYTIAASGSPATIPALPVKAFAADAFGMTMTAYVEVTLDDSGDVTDTDTVLVQAVSPEQGISADWTWLAATGDGKRHLYQVEESGSA